MKKTMLAVCAALLLAAAVGGGAAARTSGHGNVEQNYRLNESGQTYGSVDTNVPPEEQVLPELISAIGIDGTRGYVYSSDLSGEQPRNPAEALEYMEKLRTEGLRSIPLYASDGVTVLGWFR